MISKKKHIFFSTSLLLWILCIQLPVSAQQTSNDDLIEKFNTYRAGVYMEKIYVQTDKPVYVAGEICWFNTTYVDAFNHLPANLSKVAYVEILDSQNTPVVQTKISLQDGAGNGSIQWPINMATGYYKLRAYTHWMKNFHAAYFFETTIGIINTNTDGAIMPAPITGAIKALVIPEGGNLVVGLPGKVVFKLVDEHGKGIEADGTIAIAGTDTVICIKTGVQGYGSFVFTPTSPNSFSASFSMPNGQQLAVSFPAIAQYGYTMQLNAAGVRAVELKVYTNLPDQMNETIKLFAHTRHTHAFVMQGKLNNGVAVFSIEQEKLMAGITHFTVFDAKNKALLERLYFKYPTVQPAITLVANQPTYSLRAPISIEVKPGSVGANVNGAMGGLSIYRIDSMQGISTSSIDSYLYLTGDLKERIDNPAQYFTQQQGFTKSALDDVMIAQTWNRFSWSDVLTGKKPTFDYMPEMVGHFIEGKVLTNQNQSTGNIIGYIASVGKKTQFHAATSNQQGNLLFEVKDFYNNGEMVVQTNLWEDSSYTIEIQDPYAKQFTSWKLPAVQPTSLGEKDLLRLHKSTQVQLAYISKKMATYRYNEDSTAFFLMPEKTYVLDNFVRFTSMEDILREYVTEVMVTRRKGSYQLSVYDQVSKILLSNNPLILLDGIPMFDIDKVMALDPIQLHKIEIVAKKYYYKDHLYFGVINITTYQGKLPVDFVYDEKATVIQYDGLQRERVFYSPAYADAESKESRLPDYRNVLHWSGNLRLNATIDKRISFYSGDIPGKYVAVWSGLLANGQPTSHHIFFDVAE